MNGKDSHGIDRNDHSNMNGLECRMDVDDDVLETGSATRPVPMQHSHKAVGGVRLVPTPTDTIFPQSLHDDEDEDTIPQDAKTPCTSQTLRSFSQTPGSFGSDSEEDIGESQELGFGSFQNQNDLRTQNNEYASSYYSREQIY
jgi:hypothetical protein